MSNALRIFYDPRAETRQEFAARVLALAGGREVVRDSGADRFAYVIHPAPDGSLPDVETHPEPAPRKALEPPAGSPCADAAKKTAKKAAKKTAKSGPAPRE